MPLHADGIIITVSQSAHLSPHNSEKGSVGRYFCKIQQKRGLILLALPSVPEEVSLTLKWRWRNFNHGSVCRVSHICSRKRAHKDMPYHVCTKKRATLGQMGSASIFPCHLALQCCDNSQCSPPRQRVTVQPQSQTLIT